MAYSKRVASNLISDKQLAFKRIAYLYVPHFGASIARQADPELSQGALAQRPLVLLDDAGHVLAADARASATGVAPGQTERQAVARCPLALLQPAARYPIFEAQAALTERAGTLCRALAAGRTRALFISIRQDFPATCSSGARNWQAMCATWEWIAVHRVYEQQVRRQRGGPVGCTIPGADPRPRDTARLPFQANRCVAAPGGGRAAPITPSGHPHPRAVRTAAHCGCADTLGPGRPHRTALGAGLRRPTGDPAVRTSGGVGAHRVRRGLAGSRYPACGAGSKVGEVARPFARPVAGDRLVGSWISRVAIAARSPSSTPSRCPLRWGAASNWR